jgi:hypothetical protein
MSEQKHVRWLEGELPKLIAAGVLPAEAAEKLRQHYRAGSGGEGGGRRGAILVFSILGGGLIGAGLILLIAHNWEQLGRPARTVVSVLPLVAAQALAAFVLRWKPASTAWREGVGAFWTLAIGASIALVGQTYHISGDLPAFVLTWTLAALPVVYVLRCSTAALLFWAGTTSWAATASSGTLERHWFWLVAALAVPHLWREARVDRYRPRVIWMVWVLAGCGAIGAGLGLPDGGHRLWVPVFASYFGALYLLGSFWFAEGRSVWQRPLQSLGAVGVLVVALALTFADPWDHWTRGNRWLVLIQSPLVAWPVLALGLWAYRWRQPEPVALWFGALPVLAVAGMRAPVGLMVVVLNLYVLALGIALIAMGVRDRRLSVVNLGLLVTSGLILARFFDSDMSIILRALAFMGVGVGFLVTNVVLIRRGRGAA